MNRVKRYWRFCSLRGKMEIGTPACQSVEDKSQTATFTSSFWFAVGRQHTKNSLWNISLKVHDQSLGRNVQPERALCWGLIVTDSNGIRYSVLRAERPLCVQLTVRPWQNKASPSPTQKCGCLCNFNWSVFVEWGLYLLMAWGLCLPSLVEAKCHITEA